MPELEGQLAFLIIPAHDPRAAWAEFVAALGGRERALAFVDAVALEARTDRRRP